MGWLPEWRGAFRPIASGRIVNFFFIAPGLPGVVQLPAHQSNSALQPSTGSASPALIDSRIPGMEER